MLAIVCMCAYVCVLLLACTEGGRTWMMATSAWEKKTAGRLQAIKTCVLICSGKRGLSEVNFTTHFCIPSG